MKMGLRESFCLRKFYKAYQLTDADTAAIVGLPGRIEDVGLWAIFVEQPEGHYRVRMRSKVIPINGIAKNHHGGGHPTSQRSQCIFQRRNRANLHEMKELAKSKKLGQKSCQINQI